MNLCDDGHQEICYEGRKCPLCEYIEDATKEIRALNETIGDADRLNDILAEENIEYKAIFEEVKKSYPEFAI